jgi:hypothetical protein
MGMPDKMTADHPLIIQTSAKGVAHASMHARQTDTAAHRINQPAMLLIGQPAHSPAWKNRRAVAQTRRIGQNLEVANNLGLQTMDAQLAGKNPHDLGGSMPFPTSADKKDFLHGLVSGRPAVWLAPSLRKRPTANGVKAFRLLKNPVRLQNRTPQEGRRGDPPHLRRLAGTKLRKGSPT